MKVTKVELIIIDFDQVGEEDIRDILENQKYPNHCMSPMVLKSETVDIGEWNDDNPLNNTDRWKDEAKRLFEK